MNAARPSLWLKTSLKTRTGFTLVEMLVSIALLVFMMSILVEVFSAATGALGRQRAIADLDQKGRAIMELITRDLRNLYLVPEPGNEPPYAAGFLEISENSPAYDPDKNPADGTVDATEDLDGDGQPDSPIGRDTDDVLQFTAYFPGKGLLGAVKKGSWLDGLGKMYAPGVVDFNEDTNGNGVLDAGEDKNGNGILDPIDGPGDWTMPNDGLARSNFVEIAYFLRAGILYRRMRLIFGPAALRGSAWLNEDTNGNGVLDPGEDSNGNGVLDTDIADLNGDGTVDGTTADGLSIGDTLYDVAFEVKANANWDTRRPLSLADLTRRENRFGHYNSSGVAVEFRGNTANLYHVTNNSLSDTENEDANANGALDSGEDGNGNGFLDVWFGRPLLKETSHPLYPHPAADHPSPFIPGNYVYSDDGNNYNDPLRPGEDVLADGVDTFDVKVWDAKASGGRGAFVDIGSRFAVEYSDTNDKGPSATNTAQRIQRVFDTWSTSYDLSARPVPFQDASVTPAKNLFPRALKITLRLYDSRAGGVRQYTGVVTLVR